MKVGTFDFATQQMETRVSLRSPTNDGTAAKLRVADEWGQEAELALTDLSPPSDDHDCPSCST